MKRSVTCFFFRIFWPDQRNYSCSTHIRELELSTLIESVYHAMWKYEPSNFDDGKPINIQRNPNTHESLLHLCHVVERMRLEAKRFMHAETIRVCCAEKMKNGNQLNIVIFKWKRHAHVAHISRSNLIWFLLEFEHFSDDYLIRRQKRKTKRNELYIQKKYKIKMNLKKSSNGDWCAATHQKFENELSCL